MAKLVTKFKFLKPGARQGRGGYAKYIATRDGVEKIDDTKRFAPATWNQKQLIKKIHRDFPDTKDMLEYEDYLQKQTVESASEFISRAIEDNAASDAMNAKTYADYIATRPRAERFGSHGLFTDDGVQVNLAKMSRELNEYGGNVWTAIISLRREDAERLGFDNGSRWRDMLRTQTQALSENLRIPMGHLKWFAAFHNESHHPHVHLIAYSTVKSEGYLTKQGVQKLRSSFAKDIFAQDLLCIYEKQTEHRNRLRSESRDVLAEIVSQINAGGYSNQHLEELLVQLARRLSRTKGKKVYGYLKADVKAIIDSIVDEIAKDNRIFSLYDLWYKQRENVLRTYNSSLPERIPLSQNKEFKAIKNAIVQAAMDLMLDSQQNQDVAEDDVEITHGRSLSVAGTGIGMNALRLLQQTSQILQNEVRPVYQDRSVDRKLRRKINEKKQAQGLRQ
ncbi:MobP3 family relaxase [Acutalibacter sp. 1XD8-36]|uniref:MobP3 family relaxase n=1 Tax=Acutalibacter sp. 1XD8-36 TaxID=2320852 RepID=UPI00262A4C50|nr:MobP3 family relaxase [Acutalibacter sp. 1XD8-36]